MDSQTAGPSLRRNTRIWSTEAIRVVIRYNFERGLTVKQCVDEMTPHFKDVKLDDLTLVYKLYRDLCRGIYSFVGNNTTPVQPSRPKPRARHNAPSSDDDMEDEDEDDESDEDDEDDED